MYTGDEELSESVLKLLRKHIKVDHLGDFATHLGVTTATYDRIRNDFPGNTNEIRWRVSFSKVIGFSHMHNIGNHENIGIRVLLYENKK